MEIVICLVVILFIGFVYINIAPFIYSDTFGHYFRTKTVTYVYRQGNGIYTSTEFNTLVEKCNPWLMFWRLGKQKPNIVEYMFDSEETKKIWSVFTKGDMPND